MIGCGAIGMTSVTIRTDETISAAIELLDAAGNPTLPAYPPDWSLTADGIVSLAIATDAMSAIVSPLGPGLVTINAVVEADPVRGANTFLASGDVEVVPAIPLALWGDEAPSGNLALWGDETGDLMLWGDALQ